MRRTLTVQASELTFVPEENELPVVNKLSFHERIVCAT
jgi:hypothetical protein